MAAGRIGASDNIEAKRIFIIQITKCFVFENREASTKQVELEKQE
jgi:hypothetical protein